MAGKMGQWAFIVGVVLAILFGFVPDNWKGMATLLLVILGLVVGLLNVSEKESTPFLVAAAALMITGVAGTNLSVIGDVSKVLGQFLESAVKNISVFVTPAAIVVALKAIQSLAKE